MSRPMASRSPSPRMLNARTVSDDCEAWRYRQERLHVLLLEGGGEHPAPSGAFDVASEAEEAEAASIRMIWPEMIAVWMINGLAMFGSTCRRGCCRTVSRLPSWRRCIVLRAR